MMPRFVLHHSAGAVVLDAGRCLLIHHGRQWAFPKGHLERGESPGDAARREVCEETGVEVILTAPLGATTFEYGGRGRRRNRKHVDWFAARPVAGALRPEGPHLEAVFVSIPEALALLTHADDRALLERAVEMLTDPHA